MDGNQWPFSSWSRRTLVEVGQLKVVEDAGGGEWTACLLCVCLAGMCQAGLLEKLGHEYDQEDFFLSGFPF